MSTTAVNTSAPTLNDNIRDALSEYDTGTVKKLVRDIDTPNLDHIPGARGLPFVGNGLSILLDVHKWLNSREKKHGNVFHLNVPALGRDASGGVILLGPEANKLVLVNEGKQFSNYIAWDISFEGLFDNNLLQRDFADHKALRKVLQAAFKREAIEGHMELLNPILEEGLASWPKGQKIKAMDHVKELFLTAGSNVFLGVPTGSDTQKINQAFTDIVSATADLLRNEKLWFTPYGKGVKARKYLSNFIFENIPERRAHLSSDLLSHFCHMVKDDGQPFTDEEVRDQILFVLFAAHDTTTSTISSVLYALASNPEWQAELRQEMLDIGKDTIEFEDLDLMVKTDLTIKEALRMYPPLALMPRFSLEDFDFEGYRIPAYTPVVISSLFTHYMPEYWTEPHRFDPMRFSPERAEDKKHLYQYVPFGGGAHKCLGLHFAQVQSKIFLYHLLRNYEVSKDKKMTQYKYNNIPLTFPTDGLPLTFNKLE